MAGLADLGLERIPEWLAAEMPPGYQNRLAEIQRLSQELKAMDRFAGLLWQVGDELTDVVGDAFAGMGLDASSVPSSAGLIAVKIDAGRRLLVQASKSTTVIQKKSNELANVFRVVHEVAEGSDRVVLVTNNDPQVRPPDRADSVGAEALTLFKRLGVNIVPGPALFVLWKLALVDKDQARVLVDRLYAQDGGVFGLPASAGR